ncbi:hypothetical protein BWI15_35335 [Kribbella sp. ALI-6-A]|uniref:DUF4232 domain-containing protein n=1 Tax=Kribbella sp. ALI-6-A TaxID=1933817 RepID=UPI00097BEE97|nr:DUF4232 domain-containing protein [Kribbella sp. ALI-6-A]ONI68291.1 hypothetical protein BWI15_35335 [Kribbella sp. ALI-6-A]
MTPDEIPEAAPDELAFSLSWEDDDGGLRGELTAVNVGDRLVRLTGKPGVTPIGTDGVPLDTLTAVTLEMRSPGYVVLAPGARATATVWWGAWDGPPAGDSARITWEGEAEAGVTGPLQPERREGATNLSSSWFARAD